MSTNFYVHTDDGLDYSQAMQSIRHGAEATRPGADFRVAWRYRGFVVLRNGSTNQDPAPYAPTADDESATDWRLADRSRT